MSIALVIIFGAISGFAIHKIRGSGFGLWWDIYFGAAGATFASCITIFGYFMSVFSKKNIIGLNFYSILVDIAGAAILIYAAQIYKKTYFTPFMRTKHV